MIKIFYHFLFSIKFFLSPIKSILNYPHVTTKRNVIISKSLIGKHVKVYENTKISNTTIGDYTYVGGDSKLMNCIVGKFCSLGPNLKIGLGVHPTNYISTYPGFYSKNASGSFSMNIDETVAEHKQIIIKNDVWIGDGVTIVDGVTIGNGSIIASGCIVTKDVPPYSLIAGVPGKIIKYRFNEVEIKKLQNISWWDKDIDFIKNNSKLFLQPREFFNKF